MTILRDLFDRHRPESVSRLLVVRPGPGPAEEWSLPGVRTDVAASVPGALDAPGAYDAVVIAAGFERDPWPRWALQRAHRALRPGGLLLLRTDPPGPPRSPAVAADALRVLAFSARRFVHKRLHPGVLFPHLPPRAVLDDAALAAALDALHFEVVGRASPRTLAARALPVLWGLDASLPFPDGARACAVWDAATAADRDRRDAWVRAHPEWGGAGVASLDPARWAGRSVVVLSPHPDDEVIACGGTLLRAIAEGARVTCVQATDGSAGAGFAHEPEAVKVRRRLDEARAVSAAMGFAELVVWGEDNRRFAPGEERVRELAALLRERGTAAVFVPFVTDIHPDHQALARVLDRALASRPDGWGDLEVLQYEVWSRVWPTHACDVTAQMPRLAEIVMHYDTALREEDYLHLVERRNFANAIAHLGRAGYAELFHSVPAAGFGRLRATVEPRGDTAGPAAR